MAAKQDNLLAIHAKTYEILKKVRESKTVTIKPIAMLRTEIVGLDGQTQPFRMRYYQVQGVFHLLSMKRMVLGDATGTGKTLILIAALCYAWEKEAENKAVVICPKSALRQWRSEVHKFSTGIKVYLVDGKPEERKAVYQAFLEHPTTPGSEKAIMVMGYAPLVRDWNQGSTRPLLPNGQPNMKVPPNPGLLNSVLSKIPGLTVAYDECFEYHTPITLADGTNRLIGKVVCGKEPVSVLSWNWATKTFEPRPVVRWLRNPIRKNKGLVKVSFKYANSIVATREHQLYRLDGKATRISNLKARHETAHFSNRIPSVDQLQIVLGGLLGDASVSMPERIQWGVQFVQGEAQRDYLQFKRDVLTTLGVSAGDTAPSGYGGSLIHRFRLNANPSLCSQLITHEASKKKPSIAWLDLVNPLGLAVWYADDGSLQTRTNADGEIRYAIVLNTQGFSKGSNELLAGWLLWKWGVAAQVATSNGRHTLYLDHAAATRFLALLPGGFPSVMYKFPGKPELTAEGLDTKPRIGLVRDTILSIVPWKRSRKQREHIDYVYDLEVEGNHNYIANGTLVSNCTAFKNRRTKTWQVCGELSSKANRCYGLTATLLKNNLIEGFAIYKVIYPAVFTTITAFLRDYCVTKLIQPGGSSRQIPIVVGYRNLDAFRARIDPFFLGRPKHLISDELPKLTTREVTVELSPAEEAKYEEALSGVLSLGDGDVRDYEENKQLVALIYCQQTVDSLALLKYNEGDTIDLDMLLEEQASVGATGSKEQALLDLLTEEFDDEKVIVYTRFASHVPRLQELCTAVGIESVAVTGKVVDTPKNPARTRAQEAFQDLKSKVRVIFISDAGSEAINLQAASAMVFYNAPWSWGNYIQLLGRPIRIGSPHARVLAVHLVAERPHKGKDRKSIDHYTLSILQKKKALIDKVLGEAAVGALDFSSDGSFAVELMRAMRSGGVTERRAP